MILKILLIWLVVSVVVSLVIGALIRAGSRDEEILDRIRRSGGA